MRIIFFIFSLGVASCFNFNSNLDGIQSIYPGIIEKIIEIEKGSVDSIKEKPINIVVLEQLITTDMDYIGCLLKDECPSCVMYNFELKRNFKINWKVLEKMLLKKGIAFKRVTTIEEYKPEVYNRIYFMSKPYLDDRKESGFVWFSVFESSDWNYDGLIFFEKNRDRWIIVDSLNSR
jgi:hypothetical protein